jgi:hypothetical protein
VYKGDLDTNGKKHGKGKLTMIDGSYYDGEWREDMKNGRGTESQMKSSTYSGEWVND